MHSWQASSIRGYTSPSPMYPLKISYYLESKFKNITQELVLNKYIYYQSSSFLLFYIFRIERHRAARPPVLVLVPLSDAAPLDIQYLCLQTYYQLLVVLVGNTYSRESTLSSVKVQQTVVSLGFTVSQSIDSQQWRSFSSQKIN